MADQLVDDSISAGTKKNYRAVVLKLKEFCHSAKLKDKFADTTIELFVTSLHKKHNLSFSTVQANLSAIRHHCHTLQIPITFDTPRLKLLLRGVKKSGSGSAMRCTSRVSKSHLNRICSAADTLLDRTTAVMYKAMFTLAFFGLLRPSELARSKSSPQHQLKRKCVRFGSNVILLTFFSYKHSDKAVNVKVDRISDPFLCPWTNLYTYLCGVTKRVEDPLFDVTTDEFSSVLSKCADHAGIRTRLTAHSFRRGGATWLSSNGVTDARLKAYGRWTSNAYLCYVKAD